MAQCCAKFQVKKGGLGLHREMWKSKRRLNPTDFRVCRHETLSKMIETMGSADHLGVYNWTRAELGYRRLRLIEHYWDDKSAEQQQQHNMKMPLAEAFGFRGVSRFPSLVCPELLDLVSDEVELFHGIKMNARRPREERKASERGRAAPPAQS
eukprot:8723853-Pyramimonas_sp.AAC.1